MNSNSSRAAAWWGVAATGVLIALLIAWVIRVTKVAPVTLLSVGVIIIALSWLIVLVSMPWNLYFAAHRAAREIAVSRERGIDVPPAGDDEARRISRRLLLLALGGHLGSALAAAGIAYFSGNETGYYIAGIFLLATAFRPAAAYLGHVRERIRLLTREAAVPREDAVTLRAELDAIKRSLDDLQAQVRQREEDLRRAEATLTDTIAHTCGLLAGDLDRLKDVREADRAQARSRGDDLERQVDHIARRIDATLDGITDGGELAAGLRAIARIMRSQPA